MVAKIRSYRAAQEIDLAGAQSQGRLAGFSAGDLLDPLMVAVLLRLNAESTPQGPNGFFGRSSSGESCLHEK